MDNAEALRALDKIERMYIHGEALMELTAIIRAHLTDPGYVRVPEGWSVMPSKYGLLLTGPDGQITEVQRAGKFGGDDVVFALCEAMLAAATGGSHE